jgi:3-deoxy-manno-octulosonate cytidylyltransferase (CMP-KDO synthetase)
MPDLRVLGVIPARLDSTRLPRKVLREIAGVPMVAHVFRRARRSPLLSDLLVATDAQDVVDACHTLGIPAVMTSADHPSGTDRVWEISRSRAADVYVNIQGDEPLISPGHIAALVEPFQRRPDTQVTTLRIRATVEEAGDPNVVKVVCTLGGNALYFSRLPIPFDRDRATAPAYSKHLGIYAYRREALESFHRFSPSALETAERLEQLRFLEHGTPIQVVETTEATIGVDTEADLRAVEAYLKSHPQ